MPLWIFINVGQLVSSISDYGNIIFIIGGGQQYFRSILLRRRWHNFYTILTNFPALLALNAVHLQVPVLKKYFNRLIFQKFETQQGFCSAHSSMHLFFINYMYRCIYLFEVSVDCLYCIAIFGLSHSNFIIFLRKAYLSCVVN